MKNVLKKIKFLVMALLAFVVTSCGLINPSTSSSSSSSSSSSTSSSTSSSSSSSTSSSSSSVNQQVWGEIPAGVKVYTEEEAIAYMQSSSWTQFEEMCVTGVVKKVTYNASFGSYTIDFEGGFEVYSGKLAEGLPAPEVGDVVTATGKSKIHTYSSGDKIYEIAYDNSHKESPLVVKIVRGDKKLLLQQEKSSVQFQLAQMF